MARTPFKLRSSGPFKMMGSSPMRQEVVTMGKEEIVGTTTTETDKSTDTKTDYQTKGKGYTPPSKFMSDEEWNALGSEGKKKWNKKYTEDNTRDLVTKRSETNSKPKELTPQEKMAKGQHHSKYYDPKSEEYRVTSYNFKNIGTEENPNYSSQGRGKQTGDISLTEWQKIHGNVEEQRERKNTVDSRGKTGKTIF
jgi:hypothetical protein